MNTLVVRPTRVRTAGVRQQILPLFEGQLEATIAKVAAFGGSGAQAAPI